MEGPFEVIDAFADGERVDSAALKLALSDDAGRDYLVDVWLLRESVQDEMASDVSGLSAPPRSAWHRSWMLAAAAAVVCAVGGYVAGNHTAAGPGRVPPSVDAASAATVSDTRPALAFPVPAATRVIQLEFGAAPTPGPGGN